MQNENNDIKVREDLHEVKQHGSLDYPVATYHVNLFDMYMHIVRWHWHEEIELNIVMQGEAKFMVNDTTTVIKEGDGLFINQNSLHSVNPYKNAECKLISLVFHPDFLFGYRHSSLSAQYLLPLINNTDLRFLYLRKKEAKDKEILDLVLKICTNNQDKSFGYELETKGLLCELWLKLISYRSEEFIASTKELAITTDEMRAKEGISYIAAHYAEPITLQEIADSIHISKSECCRCFKRCLKITPFEYLLKYRIYAAVSMIAQSEKNMSISQIAMQTGFNSSSYFNKIFKKYMGCTPSEYKYSLLLGKNHTADFLISHTNIPK